jgi:hypothetical protein
MHGRSTKRKIWIGFLAHEFDFITTNEPELLFSELRKAQQAMAIGWCGAMSSTTTGKPDPNKVDL